MTTKQRLLNTIADYIYTEVVRDDTDPVYDELPHKTKAQLLRIANGLWDEIYSAAWHYLTDKEKNAND